MSSVATAAKSNSRGFSTTVVSPTRHEGAFPSAVRCLVRFLHSAVLEMESIFLKQQPSSLACE